MDRQARREFWDSLLQYRQDWATGWEFYEFPNRRRMVLKAEVGSDNTIVTIVTYDGPGGEVTVTAAVEEVDRLAAEVMAMPEWHQ
ncbi:hypothetical protein Drose_05690 [Dactylosporangium roseum]|uniref:Uncharacterized protein n=1 Tax=Dactylosporangium roseum TaxID=47989 RepID=A0ABY5Z8H3_9ACTN|nr:hypothetical protein [Dactylosporangium roseum]UWZ37762.1 hypothetical protein Drose_05690 [Dactylosporangium roseum]